MLCKSNPKSHFFVGTHSCLVDPSLAPPNSQLNWSEDIPSHPKNSIKTPWLTNPTGDYQYKDHSNLHSPPILLSSPPYTLVSKCLNCLNHTFPLQDNLQKDMANIRLKFHYNTHVSVTL